MAYPSSFLTRTSFGRTRLLYTGGTEANNLNTQLDLYTNLLNGTGTAGKGNDVLLQGSMGAAGFYPYTNATSPLGSTLYNYTALYLDNGGTNGGGLYFNAGGSSLVSSADGNTLTGAGFTTIDLTGMYLKIASFGANWTNAGRTIADLGSVTTCDINGGTIDGVTFGATNSNASVTDITSPVDLFTPATASVYLFMAYGNASSGYNGGYIIARPADASGPLFVALGPVKYTLAANGNAVRATNAGGDASLYWAALRLK